ncbi:MAG TPA: Hsp20/alpha crystallin family protein [Nitrobacter sp.]|jgi:HSP20 family protein|nr:Hsp20/alpha crystallin family protein [Nitrobacter sp.]
MSVRDLIPFGRSNNQTPGIHREVEQSPFLSLHREMNRLFDDVFRGFELPSNLGRFSGLGVNWPNVEISDTDKEVRIIAEVPGLEEKDIELLLEDGVLTLRGEKKSETEDKERKFSERFYGQFERRISVGPDIEQDKVNAFFKNGVLTVSLPKMERAQSKAKRITINGSN